MKNIVFIPNVKLNDNRSTPYHYSIKSWKRWSEQYDDVEVIEWTPINLKLHCNDIGFMIY